MKIVALMKEPKLNKGLAQNLAACLGRICNLQPDALSNESLEAIMKNWCLSLRMLKDPTEKTSAMRGFCRVAPNSIEAIRNNFPFVCSCITNFKNPPADLEARFKEILHAFKGLSSSQEEWNAYLGTFPATLRQDV